MRSESTTHEQLLREGRRRARPRLWHHDYLHLRPLTADLGRELTAAPPGRRVLDLGCGGSPYAPWLRKRFESYVGVDLDGAGRPSARARGEALPFRDRVFDAVLSSQVLLAVDDPAAVVAEIHRVTRPGGLVWLTCHGAWPDSGERPENRFGEPDLRRLFSPFCNVRVRRQGGFLGLPPALLGVSAREAVRAARRRVGGLAGLLWPPAILVIVLANLGGRLLERLAGRGPLGPFLGALDRSLPMNYLVVAERGP